MPAAIKRRSAQHPERPQSPDYTDGFLGLVLILGMAVMLIGLYLALTHTPAHGTFGLRRVNPARVDLDGRPFFVFGLVVTLMTVWIMIKRWRRGRQGTPDY